MGEMDVLMINLPSGGHVKVNVHNLDELHIRK